MPNKSVDINGILKELCCLCCFQCREEYQHKINQAKSDLRKLILEGCPPKREHTRYCNDPEVCNDACGASNYNNGRQDFIAWIEEVMR